MQQVMSLLSPFLLFSYETSLGMVSFDFFRYSYNTSLTGIDTCHYSYHYYAFIFKTKREVVVRNTDE